MSKRVFLVLNIIYFAFNFFAIPFIPNPILFGWLPLHMLLFFGSAPLASIIWGVYYHGFFATQKEL